MNASTSPIRRAIQACSTSRARPAAVSHDSSLACALLSASRVAPRGVSGAAPADVKGSIVWRSISTDELKKYAGAPGWVQPAYHKLSVKTQVPSLVGQADWRRSIWAVA